MIIYIQSTHWIFKSKIIHMCDVHLIASSFQMLWLARSQSWLWPLQTSSYLRAVDRLHCEIENRDSEMSKLRDKINTLTVSVSDLLEVKGHEVLMIRRETNNRLQWVSKSLISHYGENLCLHLLLPAYVSRSCPLSTKLRWIPCISSTDTSPISYWLTSTRQRLCWSQRFKKWRDSK